MKKLMTILLGCSLAGLSLGCDNESTGDELASSNVGAPVSEEEFNSGLDERFVEEVAGGSECLGSPLAGTCFDILHDACFDPDGACVEEAVGPVSTWQWDNGTSLVFEVAGFDESGTNYLTKMTE